MPPSAPAGLLRALPWRSPRWPSSCAVCGQWSDERPCTACRARFAPLVHRCVTCALPLPDGARRCGACLVRPPPFDAAVAALDYRFPWSGLISRWKYAGDLSLTPALAGLLRARLDPGGVELVLSMPASAARLRERGFDHAALLARTVDRRARSDLLLRWRDTPHQAGLDREARLANLRGAFAPAPGAARLLAGRQVALVDDVMTTGASAAAASQALREAGVSGITLWLLARTPE